MTTIIPVKGIGGGLWDDTERLKRYEKLFEEAFPGQTALDILHRKPAKDAQK